MPARRPKPQNVTVRVLLFQQDGQWIAQCLEHDITAQGETLEEARRGWEHTLVGYLCLSEENGVKPLANVPRAPKFYWDRFEQADQIVPRSKPDIKFPIVARQRLFPGEMHASISNGTRAHAG